MQRLRIDRPIQAIALAWEAAADLAIGGRIPILHPRFQHPSGCGYFLELLDTNQFAAVDRQGQTVP